MATERYEVVKFNKRTGQRIPGMFFSGSDRIETQLRANKMNCHLSVTQKEEIEFRCCPADPFCQVAKAPTLKSSLASKRPVPVIALTSPCASESNRRIPFNGEKQ